MPWYKTREPWTVRLGPYTLTPAQPGPPGAAWQLAGAWAMTYGPLGECLYGELGLSADPGLPPDTHLVQVWETADTNRKPDFEGIAGLVRGNRDTTRGEYTLTLTGRREYDAQGLAVTSGLPGIYAPNAEETVAGYFDRVLADQSNAGWGRNGAGQWLWGTPGAGNAVALEVSDLHGFTSSGYQRREYVTETSASPGDRWKRLYDVRSPPLPWSPRRYAAAKNDNLLSLDVERPTPYTATLTRQVPGGGEEVAASSSDLGQGASVSASMPGKDHTGSYPPSTADIPELQLRARCVLPISALARGSASSTLAQDATYEAKTCTVKLSAGGKSYLPEIVNQPEGYRQATAVGESYGHITWRCYVVANPGDSWDQALSREFTGEYSLRADPAVPVYFRHTAQADSEPATIPVEIPEDLVTEVYQYLNGGNYSVVVDAEYRLPSAYLWLQDLSGGDNYPYKEFYYEASGHLSLTPPQVVADVLIGAIPAANYPSGWGARSISEPTAQGTVQGTLIPPAFVQGGAFVAEAQVIRTTTQQYTEVQTGARQTQVLLPSEQRLQTAVQNDQDRGGSW